MIFFLHILGLNLKISYQIASLFHMYIDMGERIAGKQDRPSLIIEDPPGFYVGAQHDPEKNEINFIFLYFNSKGSYQIVSIFDM